jgi:hypothetical protein
MSKQEFLELLDEFCNSNSLCLEGGFTEDIDKYFPEYCEVYERVLEQVPYLRHNIEHDEMFITCDVDTLFIHVSLEDSKNNVTVSCALSKYCHGLHVLKQLKP